VSQAAEVAFVPGEAREFTLLLASACIANPAACPTQTPVLAPYVPGGSDGGAGGDDGGARDAGMREARPAVGHFVSVASPNPAAALNAVWALGPDDVWAVGAVGPTGVAYHYQQGAWTDTMFPAGTTVLYGVWASAPDSVWAVGGAATYALWNGTTWTTMQLSPSGPLPPTLTGVWGAGPDDVWIVGTGGTLAHVRRSGQKDQQVIGSADLAAVWGTSTDEVWAVGTGGAVLRRTGGAWNPQTQSVSRNPLYGVWLSAPSDVWAVGNGVTLHFDGVAWARISDPLNVPLAIWGSAPDDVWSVGGATAAAGTPFITRFDGVAFSMVDTPVAMALQSVRGSSASNVWAVGNGGLVLRLQVP